MEKSEDERVTDEEDERVELEVRQARYYGDERPVALKYSRAIHHREA